MSERESATGDLGLVQAFVNTLDLLPGEEKLTDPNTLRAWLVANRLLEPEQRVEEGDWKHALAVREAIRGLIGRNSGLRVYPVDLATLNEAAGASRLRMRFGSGRKPRPVAQATRAAGATRPAGGGPSAGWWGAFMRRCRTTVGSASSSAAQTAADGLTSTARRTGPAGGARW